MAEPMLHEMPEWKKLTRYERDQIIRRIATVSAAHRHPERGYRVQEIIDKIRAELKAGQKVQ